MHKIWFASENVCGKAFPAHFARDKMVLDVGALVYITKDLDAFIDARPCYVTITIGRGRGSCD